MGSIRSMRQDENSASNVVRPRSNTIQGSAWFAPESGPDVGNSHVPAFGRNGSWWRR
ncbi:MAG TPA: hypothetical protein VFL83_21395 [Anaeromyxobacter sp.]|nr:hypothetical protein [Anaeromyxobacter sp.]